MTFFGTVVDQPPQQIRVGRDLEAVDGPARW